MLDATTGSAPVEPKPVAKVVDHAIDTKKLKLLAETMTEFGETCETMKELSGFWKANQSEIDLMKEALPDTYKQLQAKFAEYKSKFKE